jgi:hypothetical protein
MDIYCVWLHYLKFKKVHKFVSFYFTVQGLYEIK